MAEITYYVAPNGCDTNAGTSREFPFGTVNHAKEQARIAAAAGNTVTVSFLAGSYFLGVALFRYVYDGYDCLLRLSFHDLRRRTAKIARIGLQSLFRHHFLLLGVRACSPCFGRSANPHQRIRVYLFALDAYACYSFVYD